MARIQGIKIAVAMVALVFALFTVNTMVAQAGAGPGVELDSAGLSREDVSTLTTELSSPEAATVGQQDPGFFGIAVGTTRTINQLWKITTNLNGILKSWGVPTPIALSAQAMVNLTQALAAIQVVKSFKF